MIHHYREIWHNNRPEDVWRLTSSQSSWSPPWPPRRSSTRWCASGRVWQVRSPPPPDSSLTECSGTLGFFANLLAVFLFIKVGKVNIWCSQKTLFLHHWRYFSWGPPSTAFLSIFLLRSWSSPSLEILSLPTTRSTEVRPAFVSPRLWRPLQVGPSRQRPVRQTPSGWHF